MVVRQDREFVHGHPFRQRRDDFVDQLAAERPDARAAENFSRANMKHNDLNWPK